VLLKVQYVILTTGTTSQKCPGFLGRADSVISDPVHLLDTMAAIFH